jgi:peptidoglycan/xylan/chitin deacetylase (PgdA/CDA1 family)
MPYRLLPHRLTVLAYHRIAEPNEASFDTFKSNVSATPVSFALQMDFVRKIFEPVTIENLLSWLRGEWALPKNPILITFDDGYRDNLDFASPVLQERNMPAVIFLATNYIGQDTPPFYWDLIAYCFHHTTRTSATLPLVGQQEWFDEKSRAQVMSNWVKVLKASLEEEKWSHVRKLPQLLSVSVAENAFVGQHLTWDDVRTLVVSGFDIGAHTQSHPILTRISIEQVEHEVKGSKERIEREIGMPVKTFAYPNGLHTDFNPAIQAVLRQIGIDAAFTLVPGPTSLLEVQKQPMAIRRVPIHHKDTLPRFAAKIMGASRFLERFV